MDSNFMMMHAGHEHRQAQHLQWTIHSEKRFCAQPAITIYAFFKLPEQPRVRNFYPKISPDLIFRKQSLGLFVKSCVYRVLSAVLFLGNFSEKLPFFQKVRLYKKRPNEFELSDG